MLVIIKPYSLETLCAAIGNRLPREDAETLHVRTRIEYRDGTSCLRLATDRQTSQTFTLATHLTKDGHAMPLSEAAGMLASDLSLPPVQPFVDHMSPDGGIISDQGAAAMGTPLPCDPDIFRDGKRLMIIAGPRAHTIEAWIAGIREETGQQVDWHFMGGRAIVMALGDVERVRDALASRFDRLVDAYMACTDNHTNNPERTDVQKVWV